MGDLTSTLWTLRTSQETARVLRTTYSLLRFFLFFDICYLISGIALVTMALANQMEDRSKMFVITCWRHMQKQYVLMRFPRPSFSISADVEAAVREVLQPLPIAPKDAPPRYEEVAQDPPAYEEAVTNRNNPASA